MNKYMKNLSKFGLIHNFDPLHTGMITDWICSAMRSIISWWKKGFLSLFIAFRANVRMSLSPCSFLFALHLEWSLHGLLKNQTQFLYLQTCVPLWSVVQIFSAWFYFLSKCTKERGKKLTGIKLHVDR